MAAAKGTFINPEEEIQIIEAIRNAENMTSGEIRVHISDSPDIDALEAAQKVFAELKMFNTKYRNAVLLHISTGSKTFSIYGDEGIDKVVPNNFWESTKDIMQNHFKKGQIALGICEGIKNVGIVMKEHFPLDVDDQNELSDEITYD